MSRLRELAEELRRQSSDEELIEALLEVSNRLGSIEHALDAIAKGLFLSKEEPK